LISSSLKNILKGDIKDHKSPRSKYLEICGNQDSVNQHYSDL
jgi:hypothetical protein